MSPINIPVENWLGEIINGKFKGNDIVKVTEIRGVNDEATLLENFVKKSDTEIIVIAEMIKMVNDHLDTDILLWLDGIREDMSNISATMVENSDVMTFHLVVNKEDLPDFEFVNKSNAIYIKFEMVNESFINSEEDTFIGLITNPQLCEELNRGMAISFSKTPESPKFMLTQITEDHNALNDYVIPRTYPSIVKAAICRYFNKVIPGVIHEDMFDKILTIKEAETEGCTKFYLSLEVYGRTYLMSVEYNPTYNPQEEEDVS